MPIAAPLWEVYVSTAAAFYACVELGWLAWGQTISQWHRWDGNMGILNLLCPHQWYHTTVWCLRPWWCLNIPWDRPNLARRFKDISSRKQRWREKCFSITSVTPNAVPSALHRRRLPGFGSGGCGWEMGSCCCSSMLSDSVSVPSPGAVKIQLKHFQKSYLKSLYVARQGGEVIGISLKKQFGKLHEINTPAHQEGISWAFFPYR